MKSRFTYLLLFISLLTGLEACNTLHLKSEKDEGREVLFDGKSTNKWRGYKKDYLPAEWQIEGDALVLTQKGGGYIVTKEQYKDFDLTLDWKISEGGNSGILFHVSEDPQYKNVFETGPEMQILDDERHPDAVKGKNGTHRAGANYDLIPVSKSTVKPAGEWNTARLIVNHGLVQHWLNGVKVVEYKLGSPEWEALVKNSKFASMPAYGRLETGFIALQDHGNKVWFRNIKIRKL
jgi:hypothetical protein